MDIPMEQRMLVVDRDWPRRVPPPSHRHAAPSGPWPWQDLDDIVPTSKSSKDSPRQAHYGSDSSEWADYPECQFPNWKADQVARSQMKTILARSEESVIYHVDVATDGDFSDLGNYLVRDEKQFKDAMREIKPAEHVRLRAFFVENLTLSVMQMLGTKFNVEPFFWTSSVNWIPARYQENVLTQGDRLGDHITITLKFPRAARLASRSFTGSHPALDGRIDTQRPLPLIFTEDPKRNRVLILDLLALHMVRTNPGSSTIISYHPTPEWKTTTAANLHNRVYLAGQSVYWQNIFKRDNDPTFVLLATLWYALYAWDEALETLWEHISQLELRVIGTHDMELTRELHRIRAHLLQYASLLEDFKQSVIFVQDTPNPAMAFPVNDRNYRASQALLKKECRNLLTQIERLNLSRKMWDNRLQNVMHLVFSSINIEDSRHMQEMTRAAVRDSAAMKQISYLTMIFLPASFAAGVFGMNVKEINPGTFGTIPHYLATAVLLTLLTVWAVVAFQGKWSDRDDEVATIWQRLRWPVKLVQRRLDKRKSAVSESAQSLRTLGDDCV